MEIHLANTRIPESGMFPELRSRLNTLPDGEALQIEATTLEVGCIRQMLNHTYAKGTFKTKYNKETELLLIWKIS